MGSNPQILYTPQQQMGYGGFSVPCRVGNWAEDEYLGVLQTAAHVKDSGAGMLTSQKLQSTVGAALAPVALAPAPTDGGIKFGDVVMLSSAEGGVLALDGITRMELAQEAYSVTRSSAEGAVACTRTAWTITAPAGAAVPADGYLRIGATFALTAENAGTTCYLQSQRYTLHNQNFSKTPGTRKQGLYVAPSGGPDALWKVAVLDPRDLAQMESEGQVCPANTFLALIHNGTATALYTGPTKVYNKFGTEFETSAYTDGQITKSTWGERKGQMSGAGNHWAFTTAE